MENWHFVSYEVMGGTAVSAATVALKRETMRSERQASATAR